MIDPNDYYRTGPFPGEDSSWVVIVTKDDYDNGIWSDGGPVYSKLFALIPGLSEVMDSVFEPCEDMNPSQLEAYLSDTKIPFNPKLDQDAREYFREYSQLSE